MNEKSSHGDKLSDDEIKRRRELNRENRHPTVFDMAARHAAEEEMLNKTAVERAAHKIGVTMRPQLVDQRMLEEIAAQHAYLEHRQARAERFDGLYGMAYLDMLIGQIHGRPDQGVVPGLPSLYENLVQARVEFNTNEFGILDNEGNPVEGWVLGSVIEPHMTANKHNRDNEGVEPDRRGLVLTPDGAVQEFYSARGPGVPSYTVVENGVVGHVGGFQGIHGPNLHDFHELAPYDVESAAPPSFVSGDDAVNAWVGALERGMTDLAVKVGPPPSDALSTMGS